MKLIVITTPQFFEGEAEAVTSLFQNGLEMLHLRKPASIGKVSFSADQIRDNAKEFISTLNKLKPTAAKGTYIKSNNEVIAEIVALLQAPAKNVISALQSGGNTIHGVLKTLGDVYKRQEWDSRSFGCSAVLRVH